MEFNIIISDVDKKHMEITINNNLTTEQLKMIITQKWTYLKGYELVLFYKGQELNEQNIIGNLDLKSKSQIMVFHRATQQKKYFNCEQIITNAEDYKEKVNELIEMGHLREDVIVAFQSNNCNYKKAIMQLINGRKRVEENDEEKIEQLTIEQQQINILKETEIQELIQSKSWQEQLQQMQDKNQKIFNIIMSNLDGFLYLLQNQQQIVKN